MNNSADDVEKNSMAATTKVKSSSVVIMLWRSMKEVGICSDVDIDRCTFVSKLPFCNAVNVLKVKFLKVHSSTRGCMNAPDGEVVVGVRLGADVVGELEMNIVGAREGVPVGVKVGDLVWVGASVSEGDNVGTKVGLALGQRVAVGPSVVGVEDGEYVLVGDRDLVGETLGTKLGKFVGESVGDEDGDSVGEGAGVEPPCMINTP
mmetsp:Transcript_17373/g.24304  ORF Transcript_17373/g.24304 Transcript_17373/m.24304 type:complete len:205 (-) Transcript_17373:217-831(-)|eukprot:CAMPEP_0184483070 /NCGR_PEP_ID=MMETSP0113_2-20130426/4678_1 /TAXON_ID=91329 /ORGANISM="Norrisiella sphaerica, Strain BC52" /LENGTH=204 /DNA_ID=CAMNT_0026863221 /DNA_START=594 /DNA_END=1208 /DNA_ORIENTATION=-